MVDQLDAFSQNGSGLFVPSPQTQRTVIPWDDLLAVGRPSQWPMVPNDLISSLAVLVGQGPKLPRLITADDFGRVRVQPDWNPGTTIGRADLAGSSTIMVVDPDLLHPGNAFLVFTASGLPQGTVLQVSGAGVDSDGTVHLTFNTPFDVHVGDFVRLLPVIGISAAQNGVIVSNATFQPIPTETFVTVAAAAQFGLFGQTNALVQTSVSVDSDRPWDWSQTTLGAAPAAPSVTENAPGAGKHLKVAHVKISFDNPAAAANAVYWTLKDGAGTLLDAWFTRVAATTSETEESKVRFLVSANQSVTLAANGALPAATQCQITMAGYIDQ